VIFVCHPWRLVDSLAQCFSKFIDEKEKRRFREEKREDSEKRRERRFQEEKRDKKNKNNMIKKHSSNQCLPLD
jgi:hypothetical protein